MSKLPKCVKCGSEHTYQDVSLYPCPECGHEWSGGEKVEFGAGDWVVFPVGLSCTWHIKEDIKKHYKFGE